ncbi:MAG TPA: O-antigen ligase family protein [Pyrinomonadaceae bacterium]|nr:O-antigen ligase family protein [Pyrinomonadaceae bacterium]
MVALMILSGTAGTLFSIYDLVRGRGVVVTAIDADSPFRKIGMKFATSDRASAPVEIISLSKGDTIWKVGGERVSSIPEIDDVIRRAQVGQLLSLSVITHGEHAEWPGVHVTESLQKAGSPSGLGGGGRLHRFRASGWTKHYEYFAEILQILSQLSLGLALANFQNHGANRRFKLALIATAVLAFGIAFTAMRTVLVAFAIGGCVVVWRTAKGSASRFLVTAAIIFVFSFGVVVVWQTRATHALSLQDDSASLRVRVAQVGLKRILTNPVFGHGMDAVKKHWNEWGFPGDVMIHLHSTPLQLAFDRGLPALFFWLWLMFAFWKLVTEGELATRETGDTNRHGVLLGTTGALAGFFVSSMVNYNFGAGVVALVFWWMMGITISLSRDVRKP